MINRLLVAISMVSLLLAPACSRQMPGSDPESGGGGPPGGVYPADVAVPDAVLEWVLRACAVVDTNGNGEIDAEDALLPGGRLLVDLSDGTGFGGVTGEGGCAEATLSGSTEDKPGVYPITIQMLAPVESGYVHVLAEVVTLVYPETSAVFLFAVGD